MKTSKQEFISEAEDLLENSEGLAIELQDSFEGGQTNPETVNALFRDMHTLKGLSGLFGLQGITDLSHKLESLLDDLRLGKVEASDELASFLLKNIDILKQLIKSVESDEEVDVYAYLKDIEEFKQRADRKDAGISLKGMIDESVLGVLSEYEEHRMKANIQDGAGIYSLKVVFPFDDFDKKLNDISEKVKDSGELLSTLPTSDNVPDGTIGFTLIIGSSRQKDELTGILGHELDVLVEPRREKKTENLGSSLKSSSTTVRVDIEKLDGVLNTIGEINLAKGAVKRIGAELFEAYGHKGLVVDTYKVSQSLERWVARLQEQVLDIRMIPIGQIFSRLTQIIRRYARQMNKKITLHVFGEDTNIDKYLAEETVDPLMHVARNAIDHGIEEESDRISKGKSPDGNITLKAFQRGNHVVVEIIDDGKGIDLDVIKNKAFERGLIEHGEELTDKEIRELVFIPGFSTAEAVTEVSGRGVGMDVVKERISALGGFVTIESEKDRGSTFAVTLPITLSILKSLMIRIGTERFAIPLSSITESFEFEDDMSQTIEGRLIVNLRGELLPIIYLGEIFDLPHDEEGAKFVVVVGYGERRMGFLVDEFFGQNEIVIKSMGEHFAGLKGFAGATEIGKHEIVLVIDAEAVIDAALIRQKERSHV